MKQSKPFVKPRLSVPRVLFENAFLKLISVKADFGSSQKEYFVTDTGLRAGVLAVVDGEALLTRQYRLIIDGLSWEIPGGRVDGNESGKEGAIRECLEETAYRCHRLRPLLRYEAGLDTRMNPTEIFWTDHVEMEEAIFGETEGAKWVPLDTCLEMIRSGEIVDIFTIAALLAFECSIRYKNDSVSRSQGPSLRGVPLWTKAPRRSE